jgi:hypothetical protein
VLRLEVVGLALQGRVVMPFRLDKPALLMAGKSLTELSRARRSVESVVSPFVTVASRQFSLLDSQRFRRLLPFIALNLKAAFGSQTFEPCAIRNKSCGRKPLGRGLPLRTDSRTNGFMNLSTLSTLSC